MMMCVALIWVANIVVELMALNRTEIAIKTPLSDAEAGVFIASTNDKGSSPFETHAEVMLKVALRALPVSMRYLHVFDSAQLYLCVGIR